MFDNPILVHTSRRSSVVYPYVPFDQSRCLEDNLLSALFTSTLPTKIVQMVPNPVEGVGLSLSRLAKKAKLSSSNFCKFENEPHFPYSFGLDPTALSHPRNPNWIEELKLTLLERQHLSAYQALVPLSDYQRYSVQSVLAAFSH